MSFLTEKNFLKSACVMDTLHIIVVKLCLFFSGFTQFLARDVQDTFPQLVDNGLRMLLQLLTSWKNAVTPNSLRGSKDATGADGARVGNRDMQVARKTEHGQVSIVFCENFFVLRFCSFVNLEICEISSSHGGEYDVQSCLLGYTACKIIVD
jgi:hypothetical protein